MRHKSAHLPKLQHFVTLASRAAKGPRRQETMQGRESRQGGKRSFRRWILCHDETALIELWQVLGACRGEVRAEVQGMGLSKNMLRLLE